MTVKELMRLKHEALEVIVYWYSKPPENPDEHDKCAAALFRAEAAHNAACRELDFLERIGDYDHEFDPRILAIQAIRDMVHDEPDRATELNKLIRALEDGVMEGGAA